MFELLFSFSYDLDTTLPLFEANVDFLNTQIKEKAYSEDNNNTVLLI